MSDWRGNIHVTMSVYLQIALGPSCDRDGWRWEVRTKNGLDRGLVRSEEVYATRDEAALAGAAAMMAALVKVPP